MGLTVALRVYLDTNAIIRFAESTDTDIIMLFDDAAAGILKLYTSELTLAETLVGPYKTENRRLAEEYETFLQSDDVMTVVPVDRDVLRLSAKLRAEWGGKAPDAIHVATASLQGCKIIVSSDGGLRLPPGMKRVPIEEVADLDSWR